MVDPRPRQASPAQVPLSRNQEGIWRFERRFGATSAYNVSFAITVAGELDLRKLRAAFAMVVARHRILRARFGEADGEPFQVFPTEVETDWKVRNRPAKATTGEAFRAHLRAEANRPFELERDVPIRMTIYRMGGENHLLLLTLHHLVTDGTSINLLLAELSAAYRGESPAPQTADYADYVEWQRAFEERREYREGLSYWTRLVRDIPAQPVLDVCQRPQSGLVLSAAANQGFRIRKPQAEALRSLADQYGTSVFTLLFSTLNLLLSFIGGRNGIVVGLPVSERRQSGFAAVQGNFVNMLPISSGIDWRISFSDFVAQVRRTLAEAYRHQHVAFERIADTARSARDPDSAPLVQMVVNYRDIDHRLLKLGRTRVSIEQVGSGHAKFDLALYLQRSMGGFLGRLEYAADRYDPGFAQEIVDRFQLLLSSVLDEPSVAVSNHVPLTAWERARLNAGEGRLSSPPSVLDLVRRNALLHPDQLAIASSVDQHLTYRELEDISSQLATILRARGAEAGTTIAICLQPSALMVVAQYAVLKSGAAFLPLDPHHPIDRRAEILRDAEALTTITDAGTSVQFADFGLNAIGLDLEKLRAATPPPEAAAATTGGSDLAYIIYTSGSSGKPKGVMIERGSLDHLVAWHLERFQIGPSDRMSLLAGPAFDASIWEIWPALSAGTTLCIAPRSLAADAEATRDWLVEQRVTIAFAPTPLAELLIALDWPSEPCLRTLLTGGDRLTRRPRANLPFHLHNNYGPTEATVVATSGPVEAGDSGPIDIGTALPHVEIFILGESDMPVPDGVAGELAIAGPILARGYVKRPELTAEKFVHLERLGGRRIYRTGDLARRTKDGRILFLGRVDGQVQFLGHRVELGEIEAVIKRSAGVAEAAVIADQHSSRNRLVAFVVAERSRRLDPGELRSELSRTLPSYMVPALILPLDKLPLTPNGKVDTRALGAQLEAWGATPGDILGNATPTERHVMQLWSELLNEEVGSPTDNFFQLGGTSLVATKLAARIGQDMHVDVGVDKVFANPTVASFARAIEACDRERTTRHRAQASYPLSPEQHRLWLTERLNGPSPAYNLPVRLVLEGALDHGALREALRHILAAFPILRVSISETGGEPVQVVGPIPEMDLHEEDLGSSTARSAPAPEARQRQDASRPFDLKRGPMIRWRLYRLGNEEHHLLVTLHHIVCDGGSIPLLLEAFASAYNAAACKRPAPKPDPQLDFLHYARAQSRGAAGESATGVNYWQDGLARVPSLITLHEPPGASAREETGAGHVRFSVSDLLASKLYQLGRELGISRFSILLAGLAMQLARMSQESSFVIGVPVDGRTSVAQLRTVGMFINIMPLPFRLEQALTCRDFAKSVHQALRDAMPFARTPFEDIVRAVKPERHPGRPPLVQAVLNHVESASAKLDLVGLHTAYTVMEPTEPKFELSVHLVPTGDGLGGRIEFARRIYTENVVAALASGYVAALESLVASKLTIADWLGEAAARTAALAPRIRLQDVLGRASAGAGRDAVAPPDFAGRDGLEAELTAMWCDLLNLTHVDRQADFFQLGGHSLLATRIVALVEKRYGRTVPLKSFYANPTIASLASLLHES